MLSKYFQIKTKTKEFDDYLKVCLDEIKDKKIILYGAGEGFVELNKIYHFDRLKIVAIADMKFDNETEFLGLRAIHPENIVNEDFDVILITAERTGAIIEYLMTDLDLDYKEIRTVFNEEILDERGNFFYLEKYNFEKQLEKLKKKLKNKSIIIYGAGSFFETIKKYHDLNGLNIIGISDKKFESKKEETLLGYKTYAPQEIALVKPDYVLVATKFFINIIEDLYYDTLKNSKIKIKPLVKKPFMVLLREIWK